MGATVFLSWPRACTPLGEIKLRENKAIKKEYDIISYNDKKLGESKINL